MKFPNWSKANIVALFTLFRQGLRRDYGKVPTLDDTKAKLIDIPTQDLITKEYVDNTINTKTSTLKTEIVGGATEDYNTLLKLKTYFYSLYDTFSTTITTSMTVLEGKWNQFKADRDTEWSNYKDTINGVVNSFKTSINNQITDYKATITNKFNSLDTQITNINTSIANTLASAKAYTDSKVSSNSFSKSYRDFFGIGTEVGSFYTDNMRKNMSYGQVFDGLAGGIDACVLKGTYTEETQGDYSYLDLHGGTDSSISIMTHLANLGGNGNLSSPELTVSFMVNVVAGEGEVVVRAPDDKGVTIKLHTDNQADTTSGVDAEVAFGESKYLQSKYHDYWHIVIRTIDYNSRLTEVFINGKRYMYVRPDEEGGAGNWIGIRGTSDTTHLKITQIRVWAEALSHIDMIELIKGMKQVAEEMS